MLLLTLVCETQISNEYLLKQNIQINTTISTTIVQLQILHRFILLKLTVYYPREYADEIVALFIMVNRFYV